MKKFLEVCDLFKEPVYLRIQKERYINGSALGGICTCLMVFFLLMAGITFLNQSFDHESDIIRQISYTQSANVTSQFNLNTKLFLPVISLHATNQFYVKQLDIYKDGTPENEKITNFMNIDLSKLQSYF